MTSRLLPAGLRAQIVLAIALITALAFGLSFVAVYRGTRNRLQDRIDEGLATQASEWEQLRAGSDLSTPARLERTTRAFIAAQRYHPASRIFVIDVAGGRPVSNQPRILEREVEREREEEREDEHEAEAEASSGNGVIDATEGITTAQVHEAGRMRVLTRPIDYEAPCRDAADRRPAARRRRRPGSLLRTFALVGSLALALAVLAGLLLVGVIAAPLRRMASVAAAVDAGDLALRAGDTTGGRGEVGMLASAFDRMLARLERAFARQRDFGLRRVPRAAHSARRAARPGRAARPRARRAASASGHRHVRSGGDIAQAGPWRRGAGKASDRALLQAPGPGKSGLTRALLAAQRRRRSWRHALAPA